MYWRLRPWKERDRLCSCPTDDPLQGNCGTWAGGGRERKMDEEETTSVGKPVWPSGLWRTQIYSLVCS